MEQQYIEDVKDLIKYLESLFALAPHRADAANDDGVFIRQSIFTDFLVSEYQGKVTIQGKTYKPEAQVNGFGTVRVHLDHKFSEAK